MSPTAGYQDKRTLKVLCESCFIDSLFEDKDVTTKKEKDTYIKP